jgi:hypothetical protein
MLREAIRFHRDLGAVLELAVDLGRLASVLAVAGSVGAAAELLSSSQALTDKLGAGVTWWASRRNAQTLATIRAQLDEAAVAEAAERGRALTVEEAVSLALEAGTERVTVEPVSTTDPSRGRAGTHRT